MKFKNITILTISCLILVFVSLMSGVLSTAMAPDPSSYGTSNVLGVVLFVTLIQMVAYVIALVGSLKLVRSMTISGYCISLLTGFAGLISVFTRFENFIDNPLATVNGVFFSLSLISIVVSAISCFSMLSKTSSKLFGLTATIISLIFVTCFTGFATVSIAIIPGNKEIPFEKVPYVIHAVTLLLSNIISMLVLAYISTKDVESKDQAIKNQNSSTQEGIASQLLQFKALLDDGLITESDYEKKKSELLNKK